LYEHFTEGVLVKKSKNQIFSILKKRMNENLLTSYSKQSTEDTRRGERSSAIDGKNVMRSSRTNIDAAELLDEHDEPGSLCGTTDSRDPPHIREHVTTWEGLVLELKQLGDIEQVPTCLKIAEPKPTHRMVRIRYPALRHVPSRRLWSVVYQATYYDWCSYRRP
jgi:hypothetical protein